MSSCLKKTLTNAPAQVEFLLHSLELQQQQEEEEEEEASDLCKHKQKKHSHTHTHIHLSVYIYIYIYIYILGMIKSDKIEALHLIDAQDIRFKIEDDTYI